ncbi:hypothetical protein CXF93_05890 [Moritella sp. Urea-trap-13]|nr:hypothetical protein CXF93_05890 [Moritella sp. Urea-trap-13]
MKNGLFYPKESHLLNLNVSRVNFNQSRNFRHVYIRYAVLTAGIVLRKAQVKMSQINLTGHQVNKRE